jgi:molybdenum cofactor cytidylyltransferase
MQRVAAIIVAAGASSRLGQPKQLIFCDGEPLLQRAIRMASEAGASPVLVVLGAHRDLIERRVDFQGAKIVVNDHWAEGLASSVCVGVNAAEFESPDASGVLLMTCDQPRITAQHLGRLIDTFHHAPGTAVASVYAGTRGIPAIFPSMAFPDLCALGGDQGARSLLANEPWPVLEVPLEGGEVDIDRPEDLAQLNG